MQSAYSAKKPRLKLVRDARWLYEVVVAREELISTAIGNGVALLHPRICILQDKITQHPVWTFSRASGFRRTRQQTRKHILYVIAAQR
jgi:mannitol/fructose-specific phosphotransferase system IIA component